MMLPQRIVCICLVVYFLSACAQPVSKDNAGNTIVLRNATVIDGTGAEASNETDILIEGDTITAIGKKLDAPNARSIDMTGKTIMPALISAHIHIGTLKGTETSGENYTRQNILDQLKKYERFGVLNLQVMGSDRPLLFENGLYDSIRNGLLSGSRMLSAGYGFGAGGPGGAAMNLVYRPESAKSVPAQLDTLARLNIKTVKMWVDDFGGTLKKMEPAVYKAIINEAHKRNMRVAAHLYYLSDARSLVAAGVDMIAHSIRDSVIDDALLSEMKAKNVVYIPTLSLDEFSFIYARQPEWMNDPFFRASLEPGVYEMISSEKYRNDIRTSPAYARNTKGFEIAMQNLKKIVDAGITVALGTDSGAMPIRTQGFSEHLEMELMTQAGLQPLNVITIATKNAAQALKLNDRFGTIEKGKVADLLILEADPLKDIKNTRKISSVYKSGVETSTGTPGK